MRVAVFYEWIVVFLCGNISHSRSRTDSSVDGVLFLKCDLAAGRCSNRWDFKLSQFNLLAALSFLMMLPYSYTFYYYGLVVYLLKYCIRLGIGKIKQHVEIQLLI